MAECQNASEEATAAGRWGGNDNVDSWQWRYREMSGLRYIWGVKSIELGYPFNLKGDWE